MSTLKEIQDRAAAATPGPWSWRGNVDYQDPWLAARVPGLGMCEVLGSVTVERAADDRAIVNSLRDVNPEDEEFVLNAYLHDAYGEPRKDQHLCFNTDQRLVDARNLVQFEVAPSATDRDDPRVYRADINAIRHPDAEFIAHSRQDVDDLLAVIAAVEAVCDEYGPMNARNDDVRFGADAVLKAVRGALDGAR